jgi:hypothetical protein
MRVHANTMALAIAVASVAVPRAGHAQSAAGEMSGLTVTANGCPDLNMGRIQEHVRLELATLVPTVAELPPLDVDLHCDGLHVRVTLRDSVTAKWVARDVVLSATARVDQERTLALAASELFLASWAELLLEKPAERSIRVPEPVVVAAERAVQRAVPALAHRPILELDLVANGRVRHLSAPVPTLGAALRIGRTNAGGWELYGTGGWEHGAAERSSGRVEVDAAEAGVALGWAWQTGRLRVDATGSASAMYASLRGVASSAAFYGATHAGLTADMSAGVEASVSFHVLLLGAALASGYLAPGPVGIVDKETAVRLDGPWVGAMLLCGLSL